LLQPETKVTPTFRR